MKKIALTWLLAALASFAFAQENTPAPAVDETAKKVEDLDKAVKSLAGKLSFGGYMIGGVTFDVDRSLAFATDALVDSAVKGNKPSMLRLNLTYKDDAFGFLGRLEFVPQEGIDAATAANKYLAVKYAFPYIHIAKLVRLGYGLSRNDKDFALFFGAANDVGVKLFGGLADNATKVSSYKINSSFDFSTVGYYSGEVGGELLITPMDGLKLGYFLPTPLDPATGAYDVMDNVVKAADYNLAYTMADLGIIRAGFAGRNTVAGNSTYYVNGELRMKDLKDLYVGLGYYGYLNNDIQQIGAAIALTGSYKLGDLSIAEDLGLGFDKNWQNILTSTTLVKYTLKDLLGKGIHLEPSLGLSASVYNSWWAAGITPKVQVIAGSMKHTIGLGLGYFDGTDLSARGDRTLLSLSTAVNF